MEVNARPKHNRRMIHGVWVMAVLLCVIVVSALLSRAYIRSTLLPIVVGARYGTNVQRIHMQNFALLYPKLAALGVATTTQSPKATCTTLGYEKLRETITCSSSSFSNNTVVSQQLVQRWEQTAISFENSLLQSGWKKSYQSTNQPIADIYSYAQKDTSTGVAYVRTDDGVQCILEIMYTPMHDGKPYVYVSNDCKKTVNFFGGY